MSPLSSKHSNYSTRSSDYSYGTSCKLSSFRLEGFKAVGCLFMSFFNCFNKFCCVVLFAVSLSVNVLLFSGLFSERETPLNKTA